MSRLYVQSDFDLDVIIQEGVIIRAYVKGVRRNILHVCMMTNSKTFQSIKPLDQEVLVYALLDNTE